MDFQRAQQIYESKKSITVFHNGSSIWIERLNQSDQTALVKSMATQMTVPVAELVEVH